MLCFYRWSAQGKFFGRLGEDSISIYETPVSCHPVYSPKNRYLCGNIFLSLLSGSFHFEISWQDKWQVNAVHVWLHPLHHYSSSHVLLTVLSTFCIVIDKENLCDNQEVLDLVIISFFPHDLNIWFKGETVT